MLLALGGAIVAGEASAVPSEPHLLRGLHGVLFFFGTFAYVYFLRSHGLLHDLAAGTTGVFRDESAHMTFACEVVQTTRREEPAPELNHVLRHEVGAVATARGAETVGVHHLAADERAVGFNAREI